MRGITGEMQQRVQDRSSIALKQDVEPFYAMANISRVCGVKERMSERMAFRA